MSIAELKSLLGSGRISEDEDIIKTYSDDWTGRYRGFARAVISPQSTDEVAEILNWCSTNQIGVVPQGGNTGMVGGSTPLNGELIISLRKMKNVNFSDTNDNQIVAEAGATLLEIQNLALERSMIYGVDFAARDSATIGGTIATNAGGLNVLRYGTTRRQIISVEAVTGTGEIIGNLNGLDKDNTGYHLPSLLCGSEGTLAIVTRAKLRLRPKPKENVSILFGLDTIQDAVNLTEACVSTSTEIIACELFFQKGVDLVREAYDLQPLWNNRKSIYLLCEFAGDLGVLDRLNENLLGEMLRTHDSILVATSDRERQRLWQYRELHTLAISNKGIPLKLDVTIPLGNLTHFLDSIATICGNINPLSIPYVFGHSADGNMHLNILQSEPNVAEMEEEILKFVVSLDGSISAEHGIGRAKAPYLHLQRNEEEIRLFREMKKAFDPKGILNPDVIFPASR
ncbi:MAG: FAD-binding oxidoreductase [Acidimicrobiaceae bacterium]|nr:FAD-binding oxidoreductase [Acidimicrobiaceae bacterium]|tara:strand:- start:806 stop:2170 length:1365 start_codon:yes stop_codon:yes gene_type:complete